MALVLDGKAVAAKVRAEVAAEAAELKSRGVTPGLAVVLVGEDPASQVYVRNKTKAALEAGLEVIDHKLPASTSQAELLALVERLNRDPRVDGILVQFPVPKGIDALAVQVAIAPEKDVDGLHPENAGRLWGGHARFAPCTPLGVMRLLAEGGVKLDGADAVVIGRSNLVGKPMAALLLNANATVTTCHSRTRELAGVVRRADVVVAAIGRAAFVKGDWIKPGAAVIDVGMNRGPDGKLCGDVDYAPAAERAAVITPVPGGVGPMTIAFLLSNTARSARRRL
ncbi:MAG TPA: bifunctional methylenetetrahydrofolate dehydrogenase/methenyltetrahydrofolate cyclohydrolase FolD [Polyangia bacterium]|nr:bifunctional methylenetetrahydrofolate dehydrogenase/methenyltetrahydrofolate cyclohydrolase FolD [Polyangia bacterium]